MSTPRSTNFDA